MTARDILELAELGAVEAFNVYLSESGRITRAKEVVPSRTLPESLAL
jgi:hypothetical protein